MTFQCDYLLFHNKIDNLQNHYNLSRQKEENFSILRTCLYDPTISQDEMRDILISHQA